LVAIAGFEVLGLFRVSAIRLDHLGHLVGMAVGYVSATLWQRKGDKSESAENPTVLGSWWDSLLGKGD
jgi:hypothetical protein